MPAHIIIIYTDYNNYDIPLKRHNSISKMTDWGRVSSDIVYVERIESTIHM